MITYLRMSSAWHKGDDPTRTPRSLAADAEIAAGGHGLLDVPGHAFGPAPPPVDQQHDGGQARTVKTTHTEPAVRRGGDRSIARQPGEGGIGRVACARRRRNTLRCEPWTTATVRVAAGYLGVAAVPMNCQIGVTCVPP